MHVLLLCMANFHKERENESLERLERVMDGLPPFCNRFFLGLSQTTSPLTRLNYAYDLRLFFRFLTTDVDVFVGKSNSDIDVDSLKEITPFHIELFAHHVRNGERGVMRKIACLRTFFNYFYRKGELPNNVITKVDLPKLHEKPIVRLDFNEIRELLEIANEGNGLSKVQRRYHSATALRDTTIIFFFLSTGIRVSELVGINVGDIDIEKGTFKVTRKGGNQVILYLPEELQMQLELYLGGSETCQSESNLPLFKSLQGRRINVRTVQNLIGKYAKLAVPLKNISPHKLRSTFGTNLYRSTKDIYVVADVLGHRDVNTTKKHYAAITEDVRKEAATKVKVLG